MKKWNLIRLSMAAVVMATWMTGCGGNKSASSSEASQEGNGVKRLMDAADERQDAADAKAANRTETADYQYEDDGNGDGVQILKYLGTDESVEIPEKLGKKAVVSIGSEAFSETEVKKVVMPATMKRIEADVFDGTPLETLVLNDGLEKIGNLGECENLTELTIPGTLSLDTGTPGTSYLSNLPNLRKVEFAEGTKEVGSLAGCEALEEVVIPAGTETIAEAAFYKCANLKSLILPESVTAIGDSAFTYSGIENLEIRGQIKEVGECMFNFCDALKDVSFLSHMDTISTNMFGSCTGLTEVVVPGNIKEVGDEAFTFCSDLQKVVFEEGVEELGDTIFSNMANLEEVVLPDSLIAVNGAFDRITPQRIVVGEGMDLDLLPEDCLERVVQE